MKDRLPLLAGLALLALAVLLGALAVGDGIRDRDRAGADQITVTGSARTRIVSDYVVWRASVTSQAKTPEAALARLESWTGRIRTFLHDAGARENEVTFRPVATRTVTGRAGRLLGYRLTRSVEVRSSRVKEIAALVERSSELLARGIPLTAQPPQYLYTRLPDLRPTLLGEATKDALRRAQVLVKATGAKLGRLRGVDVGVFQVTTPNSTQVEDYGVYDTSTLDKDVTAVVNVTFGVT